MVRIPVRTKYYLQDEIDSRQPMTSLFEQTILLLGDVVAKMVIDRNHLDIKAFGISCEFGVMCEKVDPTSVQICLCLSKEMVK